MHKLNVETILAQAKLMTTEYVDPAKDGRALEWFNSVFTNYVNRAIDVQQLQVVGLSALPIATEREAYMAAAAFGSNAPKFQVVDLNELPEWALKRHTAGGLVWAVRENEDFHAVLQHIYDALLALFSDHQNWLRVSVADSLQHSQDWVNELNRRAETVEGQVEVVEEAFNWHSAFDAEGFGTLRLVRLVDRQSFKREGKLMQHCVSSYYDQCQRTPGGMHIYSLRTLDNEPLVTIEVTGATIRQMRSIKNSMPATTLKTALLDFFKSKGIFQPSERLTGVGLQPNRFALNLNLPVVPQENWFNNVTLTFSQLIDFAVDDVVAIRRPDEVRVTLSGYVSYAQLRERILRNAR